MRRGTARLLGCALALCLISACTDSPGGKPEARRHGNSGSTSGTVDRPKGLVFNSACALPLKLLRPIRRGYYPGRSPEVVAIPLHPSSFGNFQVTTHSGPWDYLQRVPLVLYGPRFIDAGGSLSIRRQVTLADLAPTMAELLRTPWPRSRPGRPLTEALLPEKKRLDPPQLIVVVVWDGGGWNVLNRWPNQWPHLRKLMASGVSIQDVRVGSSPSVTPAIHATIGTGVYPKQHGIVDIFLRHGPKVVDSWDTQSPTYLEVLALADLYDLRTDNKAKVGMVAEKGWHLGMIGHGAAIPGGDKDIAVMGSPGKQFTNEDYYSLPSYLSDVPGLEQDLQRVDLADGRDDSAWLDHELVPLERTRLSPVFTLFQNRLLRTLIKREQFGTDETTDLLYTNYKQLDLIGHVYNMISTEVADAIRYSDEALGDLENLLNRAVGKNDWVIAVTADHGQTPLPQSLQRAWPIEVNELERDASDRFGIEAEDLFQKTRPGAMWLDKGRLMKSGYTLSDVARYLLDYRVRDNMTADQVVPNGYEVRSSQRLFSSVFPYEWLPQVWSCAQDARERR